MSTSVSDRWLEPLTAGDGVFCMLAIDHRDALRNAFRRAGNEDVVGDDDVVDFKCRVLAALGARPSGVLLDPATLRRVRPTGGLLVPLEEQGHDALGSGRLNRLLSDFGPKDASSLGVAGCKLLLHYRADHALTAARQFALAAGAADAAHAVGLPLVLEPLVYRLEGEDHESYRAQFADLVVAGGSDLARSGADVVKVQFPVGNDEEGDCQRLHDAVGPLPWALLGGSEVDCNTFAQQLDVACRAGASGFIAGRAIWAGALGLDTPGQERWLRDQAVPEFERLATIARTQRTRFENTTREST